MHSSLKPLPGYTYGPKIGFGSYADVYLCTKDLPKNAPKDTPKQTFAVKVFKPLRHNDPTNIRKQIDIVMKLNHPNIIKCYDVFEDPTNNDRLYAAVFQYCGKGNLHEYMDIQIENKNIIPEILAKTCIAKILSALIHLHEKNIAHRDLKLANILLNDNYDIKLADFGLSKQHGAVDMFKTVCGTPLTMAPEVLEKKSYTLKCDTWSFGVISYYLLFSCYPFMARSPQELLHVIKNQKTPKFPKSIDVSEEVKDFLKACLTVDCEKRPSIEQLSTHKCFNNLAQSKIRVNLMKHSTGEESPLIQKVNTVIVHSVNQEINKLILSLNLTESHIKKVANGFQEIYPEEKRKLMMFYYCVGAKIKKLDKNKLEIRLAGNVFKINPKCFHALETHFAHIVETNKGKVNFLEQSTNGSKEESLDKSYENLVKFVTKEGIKMLSEDENNLKKISFFKNLLEFLNSEVIEPKISIDVRKGNENSDELNDQFMSYSKTMLSESKIQNLVNMQGNKLMQSSSTARNIELEWVVEYENILKNENSNETWKLVGEALEGSLRPRQISLKIEQSLKKSTN